MQEMLLQSLGWEDFLEKRVATHSSILTWEVPWIEEPARLQSMGSQKSQTRLSEDSLCSSRKRLAVVPDQIQGQLLLGMFGDILALTPWHGQIRGINQELRSQLTSGPRTPPRLWDVLCRR